MMKNLMKVRNCALVLALAIGFTACSDDDDDDRVYDVTLDVASANLQYRPQGFWVNTYSNEQLTVNGFKFSHTGTEQPPYISWGGFTASKSTDNADQAAADEQEWINYQWGAMPKGGVAGQGTPYLLAFWDTYTESTTNEPSLKISRADGKAYTPASVYVTNNAYAYWSMKKGDAYAKKFTDTDKFTLFIYGVKGDVESTPVEVVLADGTNILSTWKKVDLRALGTVDYIYFTMKSTDEGQWGMNTPAYFALDRLEADVD